MTNGNRDEILAIERGLWTNDAQVYGATLLPDAVLVFPETGVITREIALAEIVRENTEGRRWAKADFTDVRWLAPAEDVVLLTYRVVARWSHETSSLTALASSLYVRREGAWRLAFHQQTPIPSVSQGSEFRVTA